MSFLSVDLSNRKIIYFKYLSYILCVIILLASNQSLTETRKETFRDLLTNYSGEYSSSYSIMCNQNRCTKRSVYIKSFVFRPIGLKSDISDSGNRNITEKIRVVDGDTIHIKKIKYRLYGIDAPEIDQLCKINDKSYKCGVKSKEFLISLIGKKKIKCMKKDIDRYKRIVAECFVNNINLNKEIVRNGWALAYTDYSVDYLVDEQFAKENNLGMWGGTFVEPKKWRKLNR